MKKILFIFSIIISYSFTIATATAQMDSVWADTLEKTFQATCAAEQMLGSAVAVRFSDGTTWSSTHGNHGSVPLTTEMLYDMGSSTKTMIASIIFMLEDEGLLTLNDTIYSYISPIQHIPSGIKIKHLLAHTSGVYNYTEHPNFIASINNDISKFWHPDSLLSNFLNAPNFAIGTEYRYSNTGYLLLGKLIENIENKPLNQVLSERIFSPLGLNDMYLDQYDSYSKTKTGSWLTSTNYFNTNFISFMSSAWAAGGVVTTPEDFAKYAHAFGSGQLFEGNPEERLFAVSNNLSSYEYYGLGAIKTDINNHSYIGHDGRTIQNAEMEYSIDSDFSIVISNLDYNYYYEVRRLKFKLLELMEYIEVTNDSLMDALNTQGIKNPDYELNVFPNPSSNTMQIEIKPEIDSFSQVNVFNVAGQLVYSDNVYQSNYTLTKNQIGTGVFILQIVDNTQVINTKRILFK